MAKRFTKTQFTRDKWYRGLSFKEKCIFRFLWDECDHAGLWKIDLEEIEFYLGSPVSVEEIKSINNNKEDKEIVKEIDGFIFLNDFIEVQYKCKHHELNPDNKVHSSVLSILSQMQLNDISSPLLGDKEIGLINRKKEIGPEKNFDFEFVYKLYPRKEGKSQGISVLRKTIRTQEDYDRLVEAIKNYSRRCELAATELKYIKLFSSFIGPLSSPHWKDWIDWNPNGLPPPSNSLGMVDEL